MKKFLGLILLISTLYSNENLTARAVIISLDKTVLSSEIAGEIIELSKYEGDSFKKGETLIRLDCSIYKAQKKKIEVEKEIARLELEKNKKLDTYGSIGTFEIQISQENFNKQKAESDIASINVERCDIKAPFDGRIASKKVSKYQSIKPQDELLEIIGTDNLEAKVVVPSSWLIWLKKGIQLDLNIDETGTTVKAQVVQMDSIVDPTSQSITVRAKLLKPFDNITPGMSATANFYEN
ncbi:efflux RND transporter periplasmic adaptor subunit [Aliarcobacter butzleri]|uniref:RND efflux pump membrane fusion protein barrel-sandwich domain-containing protein n=1 Tax=bioreactor metagenome TaxID=1076179 RepID=A0A644TS64_9ZZZZ|nr:efflux RND transporter periplasmic adaptor subunit [Aliarcobacter butzleri]MCG3657832.1 efflux RND transporter periplasmic adaptor subunit [Aliarcobacter butzleri]MDH1975778.1 efflux RND transporter periplasmic adaptor subunit [Aliarcobacter butzleri]MDN5049118.1 efflux RND transporter periplasmic adaptor subunit [Aliarcobacter butzleri]MDN5055892.1 efflux RND transporter periplasmic adaptor subunit [Aliarcobacter butzleri]MDN5067649.1 efflux RND transporter periplasmic adaptor subunit [Ali